MNDFVVSLSCICAHWRALHNAGVFPAMIFARATYFGSRSWYTQRRRPTFLRSQGIAHGDSAPGPHSTMALLDVDTSCDRSERRNCMFIHPAPVPSSGNVHLAHWVRKHANIPKHCAQRHQFQCTAEYKYIYAESGVLIIFLDPPSHIATSPAARGRGSPKRNLHISVFSCLTLTRCHVS